MFNDRTSFQRKGEGVTVLTFIHFNLFIINCHCRCFVMLFCILCEIVQ